MKNISFKDPVSIAKEAADLICKQLEEKPDSLICIAAGHSSLPLCEELITRYKNGQADFSKAYFIAMDEWLHMNKTISGSCGDFLVKHFLSHVNFPEDHIRLFDGLAEDTAAECASVKAEIEKHGGFDVMILGMGMNGHLALNDPGTPFDSTVRVSEIDEVTKSVGTKYFTDAPSLTGGITIGLKEICASKNIILIVFGEHKQEIIKKLLESPATTELPASVLKTIPDAQFWYA
jgi:glucosamine-6-phosphate isomerase